MLRGILLVLVWALALCGWAWTFSPATVLGQNNPPALRLKSGDALRVVVLGFPEYNQDYTVLTDGAISGVGFGRIQVAGRTLDEVRSDITKRLRKFIVEPEVGVVLLQERQESVFVLRGDPDGGLIPTNGSGAYTYRPGLELRQLLALAGPPNQPDLYSIRIYREGKMVKEVDPAKLIAGANDTWNGPLKPNDLVTLLPNKLIRIWVLGMVKQPGEIRVREGMSLYQALANAGGYAVPEQVSQDELRITVRRGPDVLSFAPAPSVPHEPFVLQSGDTILVEPPKTIRFTVGGEVERPDAYETREGVSVLSAVTAIGGGVTDEGNAQGILLFRGAEVLVVSIAEERAKQLPMPIQDGDAIYVMRNESYIYVLGEVRDAGRKLIRSEEKVDLAKSLALAGGLNERGSLRRVYVMRPEAGKMKVRQYNLDEYLKDGKKESNPDLQPGDVVLFGQPKGLNLDSLSRVLSSALLIDNLFRR